MLVVIVCIIILPLNLPIVSVRLPGGFRMAPGVEYLHSPIKNYYLLTYVRYRMWLYVVERYFLLFSSGY